MSKRRINKQQSTRIQKIQASYHTADKDLTSIHDGLVITRFGHHADVEDLQGSRIRCAIRPNINSLVAGDRVVWQMTHEKQGVIVSCYPRKSVLGHLNKHDSIKAIAANITQLIVVVATKPELTWQLLDSYLVIAENLELTLTIVLNKTDLPCVAIKNELINYYQPLGYEIVFVSTHDFIGHEHLRQVLANHTSVFVGQSGVGKSSLISHIIPDETTIQTAAISTISELGCHTTSNSKLYHLPTGGALIDSPGIREFSLWRMPIKNIIYGFREFRSLTPLCKFRNCNHIDSPACAIIKAVNNNQVSHKRYHNLIAIITQFTLKYPNK
jgi:ribosome biogenesis GTPase